MGKARIMVVEDERITAEIIKKALQKLGYSVSSVVASGEQALIKAKEECIKTSTSAMLVRRCKTL